MSTSDDPVLDFLTRWLLEFGEEVTGGQIAACEWYWAAPLNLSNLLLRKPVPLVERLSLANLAEDRRYRITQAGLDYIARGGDHAGE